MRKFTVLRRIYRFKLPLFALVCCAAGAVAVRGQQLKAENNRLEDTNWVYAATPGQSGVLEAGGRKVMLHLHSDEGEAHGSGPCNTFTAAYKTAGPSIKFGDIVSTLMACGFDKEETAFFDALRASRSYRISGNALELLDAGGKPVAAFVGSALDPGADVRTPRTPNK